MAYKTNAIDRDAVRGVIQGAMARLSVDGVGRGAVTQPEILDALRGPLEYRDADGVDEAGNPFTKGDVIPRPHADLEAILADMKAARLAYFSKEHRGWRIY